MTRIAGSGISSVAALPPSIMNASAIDGPRFEQMIKAVNASSAPVFADSFKRPLASMEAVRVAVEARDVDRLKTLLRANDWPTQHDTRCGLWRLLAYGPSPQSDGVFKEYAQKLFVSVDGTSTVSSSGSGGGHKSSAVTGISEEFRAHYFLSTDGVRSVQHVLRVLGETNPHIREFTFLLYAFTSAMLHYLPEEDCFDSVYALLRSKTDYFLTPSELSLHASAHVLRDLAFRYAKSAASSLERQCVDGDLSSYCSDWLLWIFKCLPFGFLVRVIDCYLVEGSKVLYRVALALMILYHKSSAGKHVDFFDVSKSDTGIKKFCEEIYKTVSVDKLLKTAFNIRGFTRNEIAKLFAKNEQLLRQTMANGSSSGAHPYHTANLGSSSLNFVCSPSSDKLPAPVTAGGRVTVISRLDKSYKTQRSFKFDHAIHSHVDLGALRSTILEKHTLAKVWGWLPELQAVRDPLLVFTTNEHGYSIKRFYEHCEGHGPTLLLVRTVNGEVFGAFCSADWHERQNSIDAGAQISYFGTGESFVFELMPEARCYYWIGRLPTPPHPTVDMFMAADSTMLTVGGGGGEALQVDENLNYGHSSHCRTFENAPLCAAGQFQVQTLEAIVFR